MNLEEALAIVPAGNSVIFLGSGFSRGAKNLKGDDFKTGNELAKYLATKANVPDSFPLEDAAEAYQNVFGPEKLIEDLKQEFSASELAEHHLRLASAPWRRVYTTNYDNVFELAANRKNRKTESVTLLVDPYAVSKETGLVIHLNGYIEQLTIEALNTSFKLTETSYIAASIERSAWAIRLREDIRLASSIFFVGYTMYDLDVKRILADSPALRERAFFVLGKNPTELLTQRVSRFGQITQLCGQTFADKVDLLPRVGPSSTLTLRALQEFKPASGDDLEFRDQDLLDLFELGAVKDKAINASLAGRVRYYLARSDI